MVIFFVFIIIGVAIGYIIVCKRRKDSAIIAAFGTLGAALGLVASFWGGSFVKQEIVVEQYFISPMFFDGKTVVALMEEHDTSWIEDNYIFQIKEGEKLKFIKHQLNKSNIFFSLNNNEERRLEIKSSKTCRKNMWIWFFYTLGPIESNAVLKNGDNFLTLPRYSSL